MYTKWKFRHEFTESGASPRRLLGSRGPAALKLKGLSSSSNDPDCKLEKQLKRRKQVVLENPVKRQKPGGTSRAQVLCSHVEAALWSFYSDRTKEVIYQGI